jgi:hypothetical protein
VPAEPAPAIQDLWHAATYMFEIKPAMFHSVFIRGSITALYLSYRGVTIRVARGSLPDITNPMHLVLFARSTQSMQDDFEIQVPDRSQTATGPSTSSPRHCAWSWTRSYDAKPASSSTRSTSRM